MKLMNPTAAPALRKHPERDRPDHPTQVVEATPVSEQSATEKQVKEKHAPVRTLHFL
jgi:hypothetical protein